MINTCVGFFFFVHAKHKILVVLTDIKIILEFHQTRINTFSEKRERYQLLKTEFWQKGFVPKEISCANLQKMILLMGPCINLNKHCLKRILKIKDLMPTLLSS